MNLRTVINNMIVEAQHDKQPSELNDNFWNWFGDSKVVDSDGNPLVCYHATKVDFKSFSFKNALQKIIWFTSNKEDILNKSVGAAGYDFTKDLYISMKNPAGWKEYQKYGLGQLESLGYDGALLPSNDGTFNGFVFKPTQIKSIYNKGTWNSNSPNIYQ